MFSDPIFLLSLLAVFGLIGDTNPTISANNLYYRPDSIPDWYL